MASLNLELTVLSLALCCQEGQSQDYVVFCQALSNFATDLTCEIVKVHCNTVKILSSSPVVDRLQCLG